MTNLWDWVGQQGINGVNNQPIHAGSWLGGILPDLSISEAIAAENNIPLDPTGDGSQLFGDYNVSPQYTENIAQAQTLQAQKLGTGEVAGTTNPTNNNPQPSGNNNSNDPLAGFDMKYYPGWNDVTSAKNDWIATGGSKGRSSGGSGDDAAKAAAELKALNDQKALNEQASWITQSLDEELAGHPAYQKQMEGQVDTAVSGQNADALGTKGESLTGLNSLATKEVDRSSGTLREMSQNANDLLQRLVQMYGGGSAAEAAMAGMGRTINQQRGGILTTRDAALRELDGKKNAVDTIYNSQLGKIKLWKDEKLGEIAGQIQSWVHDINLAKADVRGQVSAQAVASTRAYLTNLATSENDYKNQIDAWKQTRQGEIEDYKTKLQLNSQYNTKSYNYDLNPNKTSGGNTFYSSPATTETVTNTPVTSNLTQKYSSNPLAPEEDENGNIIK